jgi:hypothetical protein
MAKSTVTYWNAFIDGGAGEYTRLTRFLPGTDTSALGGKASDDGVGHSARSAKKHQAPHSAKHHFIPPRPPVSAKIL